MLRGIIGTLAFAILAGCGTFTPQDVAKPSSITVKQAMQDVASGLVALDQSLVDKNGKKFRTGLIADEVTVQFNVTANSSNSGTLGIDISHPATGGTIGLNASDTLVATGNRGNTITIKLKNVGTASLNKFAYYDLGYPSGGGSAKASSAAGGSDQKPGSAAANSSSKCSQSDADVTCTVSVSKANGSTTTPSTPNPPVANGPAPQNPTPPITPPYTCPGTGGGRGLIHVYDMKDCGVFQ